MYRADSGLARPRSKREIKAASRVVRSLFEIIDESGLSAAAVANPAGVHAVTLSYWKHDGRSPRLVDFENVAQRLGFRLVLEPIEEKSDA